MKDKYQIRTFDDFEAGIGDVMVYALDKIKYLDDRQSDSNVSRQAVHPLWIEAQAVAAENLCQFQSGLTPDQIVEITREQAMIQYSNLCGGNGIGLGVASGLTDEEIVEQLPSLLAENTRTLLEKDTRRMVKSVRRTRARLHFLNDGRKEKPTFK